MQGDYISRVSNMAFKNHLLHKCDIYRPVTSLGIYNEDIKSSETLISQDVSCRYIEKDERRVSDNDAENLVVTTYTLLFGKNVDIQPRDIIRNIDLTSGVIITGPFLIDSVKNRFGRSLNHKSAIIRLINQ